MELWIDFNHNVHGYQDFYIVVLFFLNSYTNHKLANFGEVDMIFMGVQLQSFPFFFIFLMHDELSLFKVWAFKSKHSTGKKQTHFAFIKKASD